MLSNVQKKVITKELQVRSSKMGLITHEDLICAISLALWGKEPLTMPKDWNLFVQLPKAVNKVKAQQVMDVVLELLEKEVLETRAGVYFKVSAKVLKYDFKLN